MFDEEDLLPISAIQHLAFCPWQCALIHLDRVWAENRLTAEGRLLHERTHEAGEQLRAGVLTVRALPLRSLALGLVGQADVVEFHPCPAEGLDQGIPLPGRSGLWRPIPVEYKRGEPKPDPVDEVQLCCQALCLEEMLGVSVPEGQIFYAADRRRVDVRFTPELRAHTRGLASELHRLMVSGTAPAPVYGPKCRSCSLEGYCLPRTVGERRHVIKYLTAAFKAGAPEGGDQS